MKKYKIHNKIGINKIKNVFKEANKTKVYLIIAILSMTIAYATINTTLGVDGLITLAKNNRFKVYISSLKIDGVNQKSLISEDGESFTFNSKNIKKIGDSVIDYEVTNGLKDYDAAVTINCTPEFKNNTVIHYNTAEVAIKKGMTVADKAGATTTIPEREKLYDKIKEQSKGTDSTLNFNEISSSSNGEGVYSTTNTDTGKEVYFYRGNVTNNNVLFDGVCWKIIRTTETNGVKLLYNGPANGGECGALTGNGLGITTFQTADNDNAYAGYMYGTPGSSTYKETHENKYDSLLKQKIDEWYEEKVLGTDSESYLEDTVWCNDRKVSSGTGIGTVATNYAFYSRGGNLDKNVTISPTLKCSQDNDRFTVSKDNGNGDLTYPVGTLSGDEMIYAGATGGYSASNGGATSQANEKYYLYSENGTIQTMTVSAFYSKAIRGVAVFSDGALSPRWTAVGSRSFGIRPAISLKEGTEIRSGEGTSNAPYVIRESDETDTSNDEYTCTLNIRLIEKEESLLGTEYCFGEECFNVIGYDGTNYKLLAKYNLYVGKGTISGSTGDIPPTAAGYGIQNSMALGDKGKPVVGTTEYGTTNVYATSTVKPYVDNYVSYLNENYDLEATGRLITKEELEKLGCVSEGSGGCSSTHTKYTEWLLNTTFYTQSNDPKNPNSSNRILLVGGDGYFGGSTVDNSGNRGVRPVIIVPVSKIDLDTEQPSEKKVPEAWQDNGIFSSYYDQAYEKLQTLTLQEKIGQLMIVRYNKDKIPEDAVKNYHISGTTFYATDFENKTEEEVKNMTSTLQGNSKIPMITAVDEEGGRVVRVSSNPNLAPEPFKYSQELYKTGGLDLIKTDTVNKSALLRNLGLNMNFAPVVDIADPTAYIYARTLGQSPEITGQFAVTVVNASKNTGVSYSLKHFPGYGNNADTHTSSSTDETSLEELWNKHLVPFKEGIEGGAEAVMISHNIVSALDKENPSSLSKPVHDLLFNDLKFTGIAITDDLDMDAAKDVPYNYTKAILAGNNIILCSNYANAQAELLNSIANGTISEDLINKQAFKVLAWKYYKGLLTD